MKLIDNRYKIEKVLKDNLYGSTYEVIDFWNNDKRLSMKLYDLDKQNKVIDYFTHNFIYLSNIKHKNLLTSGEFNIIKTIDRKKVGIRQYYSTTEYIDNPSLDKLHRGLSFREKLNIILQISTVLDFLHYRGIVYRYLSPSNIFVLEDGTVKIVDLGTIYENIINRDYDNLTRYFIAPEVLLEHINIEDKNADKYSLGMLMIYLLTEDFYRNDNKQFNYVDGFHLDQKQIKFLNKTINNLTKRKSTMREGSLKDIIHNINNIFNMDYEYSLKKERGNLNFKTKIIGREKEIKKILEIDDSFVNNKLHGRVIAINGDIGVGKTRFLKEIVHLLRMRGRDVYYCEITEHDDIDLKPVTNILRQTIKDTPRDILDKYGIEFARVLPELRFLLEKGNSNGIIDNIERLRLYDRITRYLEEFSRDKPIYLVIDNIEKCNNQFLYLLDYIMSNMTKGNILLIASFNEKVFIEESIDKGILSKLMAQEFTENIRLPNLNLPEIGELIQHILGIGYKPLKFSSFMLKESQGNPRYIEYMIKNLYATGELFFSSEGFWEIKTEKYRDIYFPSSMDESLKNQIHIIQDDYMDIMKIISIYNSSISKKILSKIIDIDNKDLDNILDELIRMGLLNEKVADWGYSYSISNMQLKKLIYYKIPKEERIQLHRDIALLLEEIYKNDPRIIMDELIYHLVSSNQRDKALAYIIDEARKDANIHISQSIILWKEAYEISKNIKSKYRLEILENLGKSYGIKGETDKALEIYTELLEESIGLEETKYTIAANIGIGEIYLKRNLMGLVLKKVEEAIELSKRIGCLDSLVQANILYNKILLDDGKLVDVEKNMKYLLEFCSKHNLNKDLGDIYNILGFAKYLKGDIEEALLNCKKSITKFNQVDKIIDSTKAINNIGNIYMQYYGDKKRAMEYYEKGLNIVEKHGGSHMELIFLNNMGEIYIGLCEYDKAKEYIEKARIISIDVKDTNMIFLTGINLGLIYLLIGDYDESYNCYTMLKESYTKGGVYSLEQISQYYNYLGEFYYTFGKWDESIKYSQKAMDICKEFSSKEYIKAKSRIALSKYFKTRVYDKNSIDDIRYEFRNSNLNFDRRRFLLYMAIISYLEEDYKYMIDILQEDAELKGYYCSPDFEYIREILTSNIDQEEYAYGDMIKLEYDMNKYNLLSIDIFSNSLLGFEFFDDEKYYQAINYLLEALDAIYRVIKNIPDRELQIGYIKSRKGDSIKDKLAETIYKIFGKKIHCIYIDDLDSKDNIETYFDCKPILSLIGDEEIAKITEVNYVYEEIKGIYDIETLIPKLNNDYEYNLRLILRYIGKETFAQKGYILIYEEESNRYLPVVSLNGDMDWLPNENLLTLANRHEKGVLINDNLGDNVVGLYKGFLPKGIRALLCIPITISKSSSLYQGKERRRGQGANGQINEGYIYLETARIFNRFDEERHKLAYILSRILYINIENYKLKSLSIIDKVTGTYTRKYLKNEFNNILHKAKRDEESFALLMVDIDKFKNINDTYGHRKGDEVLNRIGSCLVESIRSTDLVARYGGEEFIIILRNIKKDEATKIAEKIRYNIKNIKIANVEQVITISIGVSMFPKHSQFKEELIEKADQALYSAKEKGRDRVVVWDTYLADTLNRVDRLAGIISGNTEQDQRNVLAILDLIDLVRDNISYEEKIFKFLGRLIEILEAENCILVELDNNKDIKSTYSRSRLNLKWVKNFPINHTIVDRVIANGKGEFLIDWESVKEAELTLNPPNWQSVIAIPLIYSGVGKGLIYITVPIKEKEFDYNNYNLAKVLCEIFSPIM